MSGNTRRNTLILVAGMLVTVGLYVLLFWLPHSRYVTRMRSDIANRREQIEFERNKLTQLVPLHAELDILEDYKREMTERIPATPKLREFHAAVHTMCERHGVTLASDTPQIATELVGFQQQRVILTLAGRYHGLVEALHELETMSPLVEVTDLDLKPSTKPGDPPDTLDVKVDLRLFAGPVKPPATSKSND